MQNCAHRAAPILLSWQTFSKGIRSATRGDRGRFFKSELFTRTVIRARVDDVVYQL